MNLQFQAIDGKQTVFVNPSLVSSALTIGSNAYSRRFTDARVRAGTVSVNQVFPYTKNNPCETGQCALLKRDGSVHIKIAFASDDMDVALLALKQAYDNAVYYINKGGLGGVRPNLSDQGYKDIIVDPISGI